MSNDNTHEKSEWTSVNVNEEYTKNAIEIPSGKNRISDYDAVYFIHGAIRHDLDLFLQAIDKLDLSNPDNSSWHRLNFSKYVAFHVGAVHSHHHVEDTILFPYLRKNGLDVNESLTNDHEKVIDLLNKISDSVKIISPDSKVSDDEAAKTVATLKPILEEYRSAMLAHLISEENQINKQMRDKISASKFRKECLKDILKVELKNPLMPVILCWFLDSDVSKQHIFIYEELPFIPRMIYQNNWIKKYKKEYKNLLPSIFDPTIPSPHLESSAGCKCAIM